METKEEMRKKTTENLKVLSGKITQKKLKNTFTTLSKKFRIGEISTWKDGSKHRKVSKNKWETVTDAQLQIEREKRETGVDVENDKEAEKYAKQKEFVKSLRRGDILLVDRGSYEGKMVFISKDVDNPNHILVRNFRQMNSIPIKSVIALMTPNELFEKINKQGTIIKMGDGNKVKIGDIIKTEFPNKGEIKLRLAGFFPKLGLFQWELPSGIRLYKTVQPTSFYTPTKLQGLVFLLKKETRAHSKEVLRNLIGNLIIDKITHSPDLKKRVKSTLNRLLDSKNLLFRNDGKIVFSIDNDDKANDAFIIEFVSEMENLGFSFTGKYNEANKIAKVSFEVNSQKYQPEEILGEEHKVVPFEIIAPTEKPIKIKDEEEGKEKEVDVVTSKVPLTDSLKASLKQWVNLKPDFVKLIQSVTYSVLNEENEFEASKKLDELSELISEIGIHPILDKKGGNISFFNFNNEFVYRLRNKS